MVGSKLYAEHWVDGQGDLIMGAMNLFSHSFSLITSEDAHLLENSINYILDLLSPMLPLMDSIEQ